MLKCRPDFFIHSGDHIYADCPIHAERKLPDGGVWKNIVTEEKSKIAQTLAEFRGNYKYNLLDKNLLAFNAEVPLLAQWDDHEVTNDWCPGEAPGWRGYVDKSILTLAARGCRAFHEFMPMRETLAEAGRIYRKVAYGPLLDIFLLDMRSYRTACGEDDAAAAILGPVQMSWLKRELMNSQATWKIIAADLPLGVVSGDAVAQGDGAPRGRECEIADLLVFIKHAGIRNTVWVTADMHYTARTITTRTRPCSRILSRSGNSSPARSMPALGVRNSSTTRSAHARFSRRDAAMVSVTTSRPASGCNSSATWRSTASPRS